LKEGDGNTKYFHLKASGRKKKNHISILTNNGAELLGDEEIIKHVTDYYKELFGQAPITDLRLEGIESNQFSEDDRRNLTRSSDGLPVEFYQVFTEFYQVFWDVIKYDLKEMIDAFH
jgi:hypothetical protein